MDPKACLLDLLRSVTSDAAELSEEDFEYFLDECGDALNNYREWREKGGFEPGVSLFDVATFGDGNAGRFLQSLCEQSGGRGIFGDKLHDALGLFCNKSYGLCPFCGSKEVRRGPFGETRVRTNEEGTEGEIIGQIGMRMFCNRCRNGCYETFEKDGILVYPNEIQDEGEFLYPDVQNGSPVKFNGDGKRVISVHVRGGVVQSVEGVPPDVVVEVHDYDNDSEEEESVSTWGADSPGI